MSTIGSGYILRYDEAAAMKTGLPLTLEALQEIEHMIPLHFPAEEIEGTDGCPFFDRGPVSWEDGLAGPDPERGMIPDIDGPGRFVAAFGPGVTGDGEGIIRFHEFGDSGGHGDGTLRTDGPMLIKEAVGDPKDGFLDLIVVADNPAPEGLGGSGNVGEPAGEEAPGAAFGNGEGLVEAAQLLQDDTGGLGGAVTEKPLPKPFPATFPEHFQLRVIEAVVNRGEADIYIIEVGAVGHADLSHDFGQDGGKLVGDRAFPGPEGADLHGQAGFGGPAALEESGKDLFLEHRHQLPGRAGKEDDNGVLDLNPLPGSGAVGIGEDFTALDDLALFEIVARRFATAFPEKIADVGLNARVGEDGATEGTGEAGNGEVILGGAEAASHEDEIGTAESVPEAFHQFVRFIAEFGGPGETETVPFQVFPEVDEM